jgi:hypothetical protein
MVVEELAGCALLQILEDRKRALECAPLSALR